MSDLQDVIRSLSPEEKRRLREGLQEVSRKLTEAASKGQTKLG